VLSEIAAEFPDKLLLVVSVRDGSTDAYQQIHRLNPKIIDFSDPLTRRDRHRLLLHCIFSNRRQISPETIHACVGAHFDEFVRLREIAPAEVETLANARNDKLFIGGISLLSPHAQFIFGSRLDDFVRKYGTSTELAQIDAWVKEAYGWQSLAQELTGFNQLLSLRDSRAFRRPAPNDVIGENSFPVAALTGYGDEAPPVAVFFPFAPHLDALCRLLMKETETHCRLGPQYFDGLASALAVALLAARRGPACVERRAVAVPRGVWHALRWLEAHFAHPVRLEDLAAQAGLSPRHFVRCFQQATGCTAHQYLLRVRLNHARQLLAQRGEAMSLAQVAVACGFCDQAHLGRHFRRAFGTTPAAYQNTQGWPAR
jgi:AraC-like DNA-binding protein